MVIRDNSQELVEQLNLATLKLASATEKLRQAKFSGCDETLLSELADDVIRHSHVAMDLNAQLEPYLTDSPVPDSHAPVARHLDTDQRKSR